MPSQRVFNFTQFDPETAQFDLFIKPPEIFDIAVGKPARHIARFVKCAPHSFREWIWNELFCCDVRMIQVPTCKREPSDIEFARHTDGNRLPPCIQNIKL